MSSHNSTQNPVSGHKDLHELRRRAGQRGGRSTLAKYGREHYSEIGKLGARELWRRYQLTPAGLTGWGLIDRATGAVVSVWNSSSFLPIRQA